MGSHKIQLRTAECFLLLPLCVAERLGGRQADRRTARQTGSFRFENDVLRKCLLYNHLLKHFHTVCTDKYKNSRSYTHFIRRLYSQTKECKTNK